MGRWTSRQDDVLRELSYLGAEAVADEIFRRCGVRRSVSAVRTRASRIHCSLAERTVCPCCGAVGVNINSSTGLCRLCSERYHIEQEIAFNELLERERWAAEESPECEEARRERDRLRQRANRLKRRWGLDARRPRNRRWPGDGGGDGPAPVEET